MVFSKDVYVLTEPCVLVSVCALKSNYFLPVADGFLNTLCIGNNEIWSRIIFSLSLWPLNTLYMGNNEIWSRIIFNLNVWPLNTLYIGNNEIWSRIIFNLIVWPLNTLYMGNNEIGSLILFNLSLWPLNTLYMGNNEVWSRIIFRYAGNERGIYLQVLNMRHVPMSTLLYRRHYMYSFVASLYNPFFKQD